MIYCYGFYAIHKMIDGTFEAYGPDGELTAETLDEMIRKINELDEETFEK